MNKSNSPADILKTYLEMNNITSKQVSQNLNVKEKDLDYILNNSNIDDPVILLGKKSGMSVKTILKLLNNS